MRRKDFLVPAIILEFEDGDGTVGGSAREDAAAFVRGPGDDVYAGGVQGEVEDACPLRALFAPDEDFAVVAGGGEDVAVFGVGLVGVVGLG